MDHRLRIRAAANAFSVLKMGKSSQDTHRYIRGANAFKEDKNGL